MMASIRKQQSLSLENMNILVCQQDRIQALTDCASVTADNLFILFKLNH